jgi:hypothetical protein
LPGSALASARICPDLLGSAIFDVVVLQWLDRIVGGLQKADRRLQIG